MTAINIPTNPPYFPGINYNPAINNANASTQATVDNLKQYFLSYPAAQGREFLSDVVVNGDLIISDTNNQFVSNINMSISGSILMDNSANFIQFGDGTKQYTANNDVNSVQVNQDNTFLSPYIQTFQGPVVCSNVNGLTTSLLNVNTYSTIGELNGNTYITNSGPITSNGQIFFKCNDTSGNQFIPFQIYFNAIQANGLLNMTANNIVNVGALAGYNGNIACNTDLTMGTGNDIIGMGQNSTGYTQTTGTNNTTIATTAFVNNSIQANTYVTSHATNNVTSVTWNATPPNDTEIINNPQFTVSTNFFQYNFNNNSLQLNFNQVAFQINGFTSGPGSFAEFTINFQNPIYSGLTPISYSTPFMFAYNQTLYPCQVTGVSSTSITITPLYASITWINLTFILNGSVTIYF
jgi:hypothetical protein